MAEPQQPLRDNVAGISWEARPEWLAGSYWWRVYVAGHPKVLVRFADSAVAVGKALAADEAQFRRDARAGESLPRV